VIASEMKPEVMAKRVMAADVPEVPALWLYLLWVLQP
jgi:hypothetical protein